jgi:hypothetical protein
LKNLGTDGSILLRSVSVDRIHLAQDRNQQLAVELSYISSVSIKCRKFLSQLRNYQLLKEDPAPKG